ncbi:hypothetical protein EDD85DRAFT_263442 [Armillaria nabsnona]|nr:hypothetical protein EDD85DRAFT_263442 [Armillaria nabsnona]
MRKGLAIDVADMEVDGSVFRKKHGRILVPWVERLDELWLISGYLGYSPESCVMNYHGFSWRSCSDPWASQLGMDMEVYGKTLRVFDQKHGCLVDPEELVYSTIHGFINGSPLDERPPESCVMNYHRSFWHSFSDPCDQWARWYDPSAVVLLKEFDIVG